MRTRVAMALLSTLGLVACGGTDDEPTPTVAPDAVEVPATYVFADAAGESTVSYSGQILRHVLIHDLKAHIGGLTDRINDGSFTPVAGDVVDELAFYYEFDSDTAGTLNHEITADSQVLQSSYDDISSGKDLRGKLAGNDEVGQHKDWSTDFQGWSLTDIDTPDSLVFNWFQLIEDLAVQRASGEVLLDPTGSPIGPVFVTAAGHDLQQLIQKFMDGAIGYSQGTDDYLDDDVDGKGLNSSNAVEEGASYSELAHAWDEAFGYFGAARDYSAYTDDEIAGAEGREGWSQGYHDTDGDGFIDLTSEYNFGHSLNAAKRDRGGPVESYFSDQAIQAFLTGRAIIQNAGDVLTDAELVDLKAQRDLVVGAWEAAIAATCVHYINDTLADMASFGTDNYDFTGHAKHWSELKGFALALQFNPRSALSDSQFAALHDAIGDAPNLPGQEGADVYRQGLIDIKGVLESAYGFDSSNMGDDDGEGGW